MFRQSCHEVPERISYQSNHNRTGKRQFQRFYKCIQIYRFQNISVIVQRKFPGHTKSSGGSGKTQCHHIDQGAYHKHDRENILLQEGTITGDADTDNRDAVDISVADDILDTHNTNSISGLQATVTEKNFAGGQLRVTLKLSDGTELIASRYGIDASVTEGQTVRCSFLPTDAVLVDREDIHEEA